MCREGAWAELTVKVTFVVWIRGKTLGFKLKKQAMMSDSEEKLPDIFITLMLENKAHESGLYFHERRNKAHESGLYFHKRGWNICGIK